MKNSDGRLKKRYRSITILLLVIVMIITAATAYARYIKKTEQKLEFEVGQSIPLTVESELQWKEIEDEIGEGDGELVEDGAETAKGGVELAFAVTKGEEERERAFSLELLATAGLNPETATVELVVPLANEVERIYVGVPEAIAEDSELYEQMGAGTCFRFLTESGEAAVWQLDAEKKTAQSFALRIRGDKEDALLELVIVPVHN